MNVRWGIGELPALLAELGIERPLVLTTARWAQTAAGLPAPVAAARTWAGVQGHAPREAIDAAVEQARATGADGLVPLGGGSAIDTAKAVSSETGLPVCSIPTSYSGAEWTTGYGSRDARTRTKSGAGGARTIGIVYEPALTLGLPIAETVGTALNALDHAAEALYSAKATPETDADALEGARLISEWLPRVVAAPGDLEARTGLLQGAARAGASLRAGYALAHAMAQALGGYSGGSHGGFNALVLPPVLRFNAEAAAPQLARLAEALGAADPAARTQELARLGGWERLRDLGIAESDLPAIAEASLGRPSARHNPRPVNAADVEALLREIW